MDLSPFAVQSLAPFISGDQMGPYRKGKELVKLFNSFGCRDTYDELGLPDIGKQNEHRPSRTEYAENRMRVIGEKGRLRELLVQVLTEANSKEIMVEQFNRILSEENFTVVEENGTYRIDGGVIKTDRAAANDAHFEQIQKQILDQLDWAKVYVLVAMAWFTNETLRDKLLEKKSQGLDVHVIIFNDGINRTHGVDLTGIPHTMIRGTRGGFMHNKFCVLDNQRVLTGSYNWSTNAETRNDENVTVLDDPDQATKYTLEFRRLLNS